MASHARARCANGARRPAAAVVAAATLLLAMVCGSHAAMYTVGDFVGWAIPNSMSLYQNWANGAAPAYYTGDVLIFNYTSRVPVNVHFQTTISSSGGACAGLGLWNASIITPGGSLIGPYGIGNTVNYTLTIPGYNYFASSVPGQCQLGMQFELNVMQAAPAPTPAPAPAPAPSSSMGLAAPAMWTVVAAFACSMLVSGFLA